MKAERPKLKGLGLFYFEERNLKRRNLNPCFLSPNLTGSKKLIDHE
jgi:hypothetical protein